MNYILFLFPAGGLCFLLAWVWFLCSAIRHDRDLFWVWILLLVPPVGIVMYVVNFHVLDDRRNGLGAVVARRSRSAEAARLLSELHETDLPATRERLATLLHEAGDHQEALKHLAKALEFLPDDLRLQFLAARCLLALGRPERAFPHLEFITAEQADYAGWQALVLQAQTAAALNRPDEAVRLAEVVLQRSSAPSAAVPAAELLISLGRPEVARAALQTILRDFRTAPGSFRREDALLLRRAAKLIE